MKLQLVFEISIFTLAVQNLQFNCDQCYKTNSSKRGGHKIYGLNNILVRPSYITIWIIAVRFIKKNTQRKEEGNMKSKMENVPKGHLIQSNHINIWNVYSKYHTTTDHTKRHMKIYTIQNPFQCFLCAKIYLQKLHEELCLRKYESLQTVWKGSHNKEPLKETQ